MTDLKQLFEDKDAVASYLIQVTLNPRRTPGGNVRGSFKVFRKSGWFGKADTLMNFCPANACMGTSSNEFSLTVGEVEVMGEDNLMDPTTWPRDIQHRYHQWWRLPVLCDKCGAVGIREELPDSYGFQMPVGRIAKRMADLAHTLGLDVDIYLVRQPESHAIQRARLHMSSARINLDKVRGSLDKARQREQAYYKMVDIIRDTSTGADLTARFKAFLEA